MGISCLEVGLSCIIFLQNFLIHAVSVCSLVLALSYWVLVLTLSYVLCAGLSACLLKKQPGKVGFWCSVCKQEFCFGKTGKKNAQQHVEGGEHRTMSKRRPPRAAGAASNATQPPANEALSMLYSARQQQSRYFHAPTMAMIAPDVVRTHVQKHRCLGLWSDTVSYTKHGVVKLYDVTGIRSMCCMPGENWYADPHFEWDGIVDGEEVSVRGCFRHRRCEVYDCELCPLIPSFQDFRMRVYRAAGGTDVVGERQAVVGMQYEYMAPQERVAALRASHDTIARLQRTVRSLSRKVALAASRRLTVDTVSRGTDALLAGEVRELAEIFRRCADSGAFEGRTAMLHVLMDIGKNVESVHRTGKKNGQRFSGDHKALYEMIFHIGGRLMHDFVSLNLMGPCLNTSKKEYRQVAVRFDGTLKVETTVAVADVLMRLKSEKGIDGPVPLEISEDETAIIAQATYNRRSDTIDGFCGRKGPDHRCSFDAGPSAVTYESITTAFQTLVVAKNVRLLVLNPLHPQLPRLPLAILPTCMRFDADQVFGEWICY